MSFCFFAFFIIHDSFSCFNIRMHCCYEINPYTITIARDSKVTTIPARTVVLASAALTSAARAPLAGGGVIAGHGADCGVASNEAQIFQRQTRMRGAIDQRRDSKAPPDGPDATDGQPFERPRVKQSD